MCFRLCRDHSVFWNPLSSWHANEWAWLLAAKTHRSGEHSDVVFGVPSCPEIRVLRCGWILPEERARDTSELTKAVPDDPAENFPPVKVELPNSQVSATT